VVCVPAPASNRIGLRSYRRGCWRGVRNTRKYSYRGLYCCSSSSPHPSPTWRPPKPAEGITILIRTTHASMQTLIIQLGQSGGQLALAGLTMRVRFADGDGLRHASDWPQHRCALLRSMPGEGLASSILLWNLFQWPACLPAPISHRVARSELLFKTCNAPPFPPLPSLTTTTTTTKHITHLSSPNQFQLP
jgi:hypothetical protein